MISLPYDRTIHQASISFYAQIAPECKDPPQFAVLDRAIRPSLRIYTRCRRILPLRQAKFGTTSDFGRESAAAIPYTACCRSYAPCESEVHGKTMLKFLHAADIHLDSPLRGLQRYEGAPVDDIRQATRGALENLVELAIDQSVAFVLIAGDLYDGDWKDHRTGLYFVSQMVRLREAGIPVIAIAGNHDAANKMTRTCPCRKTSTCSTTSGRKQFCLEQWGVRSTARALPRRPCWKTFPPPTRRPWAAC